MSFSFAKETHDVKVVVCVAQACTRKRVQTRRDTETDARQFFVFRLLLELRLQTQVVMSVVVNSSLDWLHTWPIWWPVGSEDFHLSTRDPVFHQRIRVSQTSVSWTRRIGSMTDFPIRFETNPVG